MMEEDILTQEPAAATSPAADIPAAPEEKPILADAAEPQGLQGDPFRLSVRYNKQDYHLSVDEATAYAQKGMKYDSLAPVLDKLQTLAKANGQSLAVFTEALCGNSVDEVPDLSERLADEFCQLQEECPELTEFGKVPEAAVRLAAESGLPLLDAYLRYCHAEQRRIESVQTAARMAGEASAGTQRGEPQDAPDAVIDALMKGLNG